MRHVSSVSSKMLNVELHRPNRWLGMLCSSCLNRTDLLDKLSFLHSLTRANVSSWWQQPLCAIRCCSNQIQWRLLPICWAMESVDSIFRWLIQGWIYLGSPPTHLRCRIREFRLEGLFGIVSWCHSPRHGLYSPLPNSVCSAIEWCPSHIDLQWNHPHSYSWIGVAFRSPMMVYRFRHLDTVHFGIQST